MDTKSLNTWVEISEDAYVNNLNFFKDIISPKTELALVIKANAYGHGMLEIAGMADKHDIKTFCVHSLDEAKILREKGFSQNILVMGRVPLARLGETIELDLQPALYNLETLQALDGAAQKLNKQIKVHLKLETGTNRQGITEDNLDNFLDVLKTKRFVKLEAAYSHFASVEDASDNSYAIRQLEQFNKMCDKILENGFTGFKRHIAASAAALLLPQTHFDMIRVGISQYGLWPAQKVKNTYSKTPSTSDVEGRENKILSPVMSWKTRVSQIKNVPKGSFIGYGCSYQAKEDMIIAILPIGYSDGYDRKLGNKGHVLINGQHAPVVGRICMNLTMVDIMDIKNVKLEDEVVLLGEDGAEKISAEYLADLIGTINYEVVTRINWQIPRIIT